VSADARGAVLERIRADERFVVATHENPDGDALGSLIAMHHILRELGKDVVTFMSDHDFPLPPEYRSLRIDDLVHQPPADIARRTAIALDCGNIDRTPDGVLDRAAQLLNIDHHHDNTRFGSVNLISPKASCTAEIVFELMGELGVRPQGEIAQALYIALVTDTGRFMYESTGPGAHRMAAALIEAGVDVQAIYRRLFEDVPEAKLMLLGRALQSMARYDGGILTVATLSASDFTELGAEQSFSEGVVDHLRAVRGTRVAALMRGLSEGGYKISLRATDDSVDVSVIARAQGGGGHRRAAGFQSDLSDGELITFLRAQIAAQLDPRDLARA
jgi:phosphoesterase RecJ-like protein